MEQFPGSDHLKQKSQITYLFCSKLEAIRFETLSIYDKSYIKRGEVEGGGRGGCKGEFIPVKVSLVYSKTGEGEKRKSGESK